jgi:hypothetical protein
MKAYIEFQRQNKSAWRLVTQEPTQAKVCYDFQNSFTKTLGKNIGVFSKAFIFLKNSQQQCKLGLANSTAIYT